MFTSQNVNSVYLGCSISFCSLMYFKYQEYGSDGEDVIKHLLIMAVLK